MYPFESHDCSRFAPLRQFSFNFAALFSRLVIKAPKFAAPCLILVMMVHCFAAVLCIIGMSITHVFLCTEIAIYVITLVALTSSVVSPKKNNKLSLQYPMASMR